MAYDLPKIIVEAMIKVLFEKSIEFGIERYDDVASWIVGIYNNQLEKLQDRIRGYLIMEYSPKRYYIVEVDMEEKDVPAPGSRKSLFDKSTESGVMPQYSSPVMVGHLSEIYEDVSKQPVDKPFFDCVRILSNEGGSKSRILSSLDPVADRTTP